MRSWPGVFLERLSVDGRTSGRTAPSGRRHASDGEVKFPVPGSTGIIRSDDRVWTPMSFSFASRMSCADLRGFDRPDLGVGKRDGCH